MSSSHINTPYPEPLITPPPLSHKQTHIILHGRGSTAAKFAPPLLASPISDSQTLQEAFPHAKFLFPTAPRRRSTVYNRSMIHQWFDCWRLSEPEKREELQYDGLEETCAYLHGLLRQEIALVGAENVVLWGLSMGCAASLIALLTWEGEPFGAVVGMCGWLPLRRKMEDLLRDGQAADTLGGGEEDDCFETDSNAVVEDVDPVMRTIAWLREELDSSTVQTTMAFQRIPIFLGHGVEDPKVPVEMGQNAAVFLKGLGMNVRWKSYQGLGHWYSKDMLIDVIEHLGKDLG